MIDDYCRLWVFNYLVGSSCQYCQNKGLPYTRAVSILLLPGYHITAIKKKTEQENTAKSHHLHNH